MSPQEFPVTGPIEAAARLPSGVVTVRAQPTQAAIVTISGRDRRGEAAAAAVKVEYQSGRLSIIAPDPGRFLRSSPRLDISVTLPPGSAFTANTASASVRGSGELARLAVNTASGDVHTDLVTSQADVTTVSGDVTIGSVKSGRISVNTTSGKITVVVPTGVDVQLDLSTISGKVRNELKQGTAGEAQATVSCRSISGDVTAKRAA